MDDAARSRSQYRPSKALWFWSCIVCLIIPVVLGFTWGGWVTPATLQRMSDAAADAARAQVVATYCVNKVESAPDSATKIAALMKTEIWRRGDLIDKGGWTTLPGQSKPVDGAGELCAQRLVASATAKANST